MTISASLQAPEWISSGATITGGLDLLGLRLPVQTIGGTLLDGVTTVTPSVRYLAFRAWLIYRYVQRGGANSWQRFTDFAARVESALVLGNLTGDPSIGGLIGSDQALERLALGEAQVQISSLVKSPASTIYAGPSDQLGISKSRDNAVPALVMERGLPSFDFGHNLTLRVVPFDLSTDTLIGSETSQLPIRGSAWCSICASFPVTASSS